MRTLGKTGLVVSDLGFGGIPIQRIKKEEAIELISYAIDKGINMFDSARGYTISEEYIGEALYQKAKEIEGLREKVVICTKSMARSYLGMKDDIEKSLKNFKTSYIDLYQIHFIQSGEDYSEAYKALLEAKEEGKIKHIGITSHDVKVLEKIIEKDEFETIQFPYNILENQGEELFKKAYSKNIGIICMKPFAGGAIDEKVLALKYILNSPYNLVGIPGMEDKKQIDENLSASIGPYSKGEESKIKEIRDILGCDFCRRCGYCKPCSVGIDIPIILNCVNYYKRYHLEGWAKDKYNASKVKASSCIECGACEKRCPYKLNIINKLKEAKNIFER